MKKFCIVFAALLILLLTAAATATGWNDGGAQTQYLRMHVRANSDSAADQAVKYEVKDAVVDALIPVAADCGSKQEAMEALQGALPRIEAVADAVLAERGFAYTAHAEVRREEFPARVYESVTLEAGLYDALIVELGEGAGANWWCVVYPPLCFSGEATGGNIRYRSRLLEIIQNFFAG